MGVNGYQWSPIWPRFGHSNLQVLNAYIAQQYGCLHEREPGRRGLQPALGSTQKAKNSQRVEFFAFSCGVFVITKNPEVRKSGAVGNVGKARVDASPGRRRILPPWPRVPCRRTERSGGFGDLVGHLFSSCFRVVTWGDRWRALANRTANPGVIVGLFAVRGVWINFIRTSETAKVPMFGTSGRGLVFFWNIFFYGNSHRQKSWNSHQPRLGISPPARLGGPIVRCDVTPVPGSLPLGR